MCIRLPTHSATFPDPQLAEEASVCIGCERDRVEELSGRQSFAVLTLLGIVLLLMLAPALVAAASLLDPELLNRFQGLFSWSGVPTRYFDLARFGATPLLACLLSLCQQHDSTSMLTPR